MPRPLHDLKQPQAGPTAGDLGQSAYRANRQDEAGNGVPGHKPADRAWASPEPRNAPPGRKRGDGPSLRMGREARD